MAEACITIGAVNYEPGSSRNYKTGTWRAMRPVLDQDKCIKCGLCHTYCPDSAVVKAEDRSVSIDYDYCKGCGICAHECPKQAITMVEEEK